MEQQFEEAAALFSSRDYHKAIEAYSELVDKDRIRAINNISACFIALKDYSNALKYSKELLNEHPNDPQANFRAAQAYEGLLHYEEALFHLHKAIAMRQGHPPYVEAVQRVRGLMATGHGVASQETKQRFYYEKSVKAGAAAMKEKKYFEAVHHFTKALDIFSTVRETGDSSRELAILYANRSAAYFNLSAWVDSVTDAERAIEVDPTYARGFYRLACAKEQKQEYDDAFDAAAQCLRVDPENDASQKLQERVRPHRKTSRKTGRERVEEVKEKIQSILEEEKKDRVASMNQDGVVVGGHIGTARRARGPGYTYCVYCNDTGHVKAECPLLRAKRRRY